MIYFAELAFDSFYPQRPASCETLAMAEPMPLPTTKAFAELARRRGVVVILSL